jgi:hypothetical protein
MTSLARLELGFNVRGTRGETLAPFVECGTGKVIIHSESRNSSLEALRYVIHRRGSLFLYSGYANTGIRAL